MMKLAFNLNIYERKSGKGDNRVPSWKSKDHITGDNIYQIFKDFWTVFNLKEVRLLFPCLHDLCVVPACGRTCSYISLYHWLHVLTDTLHMCT